MFEIAQEKVMAVDTFVDLPVVSPDPKMVEKIRTKYGYNGTHQELPIVDTSLCPKCHRVLSGKSVVFVKRSTDKNKLIVVPMHANCALENDDQINVATKPCDFFSGLLVEVILNNVAFLVNDQHGERISFVPVN